MNEKSNRVTRRKFLLHLSVMSPVLALFALKGRDFVGLTFAQTATPAATLEPTALDCVASPSMTEGPYFVDEMLKRVDIRTDPTDNTVKQGVPLNLQITVFNVNGNACSPLKGAQIDIWHCDATGLYSDEARTFSADGTQSYAFNTQLFFDDKLTDQIHAQAPYNAHGNRDTTNATDMVYNGTDAGAATPDAHDLGEKMLLTLTKDGDGYAAKLNIGVDLSKPSAQSFTQPGSGGQPPRGGNPGFGTPPAIATANN